MTDKTEKSEKFPFDEELAASYVGKYILLGITYEDSEGNVERQQQLHGVITSATRDGIAISLRGIHDGTTWNMPPALDSIRPAEPGTYTLRSTNETIENPDLLATWLVAKGPPADCD
jgi:hypothetical protein